MAFVMPGRDGDEHDAGTPVAWASVAAMIDRGALFARGDVGHAFDGEGVEQAQVVLARQAVDAPDTGGAQRPDECARHRGVCRAGREHGAAY